MNSDLSSLAEAVRQTITDRSPLSPEEKQQRQTYLETVLSSSISDEQKRLTLAGLLLELQGQTNIPSLLAQ